jgi:hypothetical protein
MCLVNIISFAQFDSKEITDTIVTFLNQMIEKEDDIIPDKNGRVQDISLSKNSIRITLDLSPDFLANISEEDVDEINEHLLPLIPNLNVSNYFIGVEQRGQFVELGSIRSKKRRTMPMPAPMANADEEVGFSMKGAAEEIPDLYTAIPNIKKRQGILNNKTVWLSAGHGWLYKHNRWKTQRKNKDGIVEDFGTIEVVNQYLLKYLENAGANVWTVRERDMNANEVIVDDESEGFSTRGYWAKSASKGFNKNYRYVYSKGNVTAAATYTPEIPEAGWYWVSTYYRNGNNRSKDTRYIVRHAGGESVVSISQETHGLTWVYLGQFYFEKGKMGSVTLTNQSSDLNQAIIADAVRFGGGKSSIPDKVGGLSNEPRFEEGALYYTKYQGYPYGESDVAVRPRYAEWELAKGTWSERNNACYVSWHTNAGQGRGTGTETFIYNGKYTKGSPSLRKFIHQEVVNDIRAEWDENWVDRGQKSANFGELRNLSTMPGALVEIGFHDHKKDLEAIKSPEFRKLTARAVYQGITRYFAAKDGKKPVFLPEPPTHLSASNVGNSSILLKWKAPQFGGAGGDKATAYKVYVSTHGKAFSEGIQVYGTSYTLLNLKPGKTYFFKITASNAGGESFETSVVAARTPNNGSKQVDFLIVDGFDRLDKSAAIRQYDGSYLGTTQRHFYDRMNSYDYSVLHARALEKVGYSFDGATNEAVQAGHVLLMKYPGIDWFLGEESIKNQTLNYKERALIKRYLNSGGALMISGSEHAYELSRNTQGVDPDFYRDYLKSAYYADDAGTYNFLGENRSSLSRMKGFVDNGKTLYNVEYPDVLIPYGGAKSILKYQGGIGGTAAIAYLGEDFKVVNFGFPLESIPIASIRNELIGKAAKMLIQPKQKTVDIVVDFEGKPKRNREVDVSNLPNPANISPAPFEGVISIDLSDIETGRASFTLRNSSGIRVKVIKWSHRLGQKKYLSIDKSLANGIYDYEIVVGSRTLRGKIYKKS